MPEPLFDAPKGMRETGNRYSRPRRRRRVVARSPNNTALPADPALNFRVYFSDIAWNIWNEVALAAAPDPIFPTEYPSDPTSHS